MHDHNLLNEFTATANDEAFGKLVERYGGLVLGVAMRRTRNRQLAEEMSQNVFLILARKAKDLRRNPNKLPGWLHRTTVLEARNLARKEAHRTRKMEELHQQEQAEAIERSQSNQASNHEMHLLLDEAIDALPNNDRKVVLLRFFEGKAYKELGAALGKSDDACQKQLTRALGKLSQFFQRKGVAISATALGSLMTSELAKAAPLGLHHTITTSVLTGAHSITQTQLLMHTYQSLIYSKAAVSSTIAVASATVAAPLMLLWQANADEPDKTAQTPASEQVSPPTSKRRYILPPGGIRREIGPQASASSSSNIDEFIEWSYGKFFETLADDEADNLRTLLVEQERLPRNERAGQIKKIKTLLGDEGYEALQDHRTLKFQRRLVGRWQSSLEESDQPDKDTAEKLARMMRKIRSKHGSPSPAFMDSNGETRIVFTGSGSLKKVQNANAEIEREASSLLTADQLASLKAIHQQVVDEGMLPRKINP